MKDWLWAGLKLAGVTAVIYLLFGWVLPWLGSWLDIDISLAAWAFFMAILVVIWRRS